MAFFNFDRRIISPTKKPWGFKYLFDLIKTITTQSDWQEGTLTGVVADSGDYLRLVDTNVLSFDGNDDSTTINDILEDPLTIEAWVLTSNDDSEHRTLFCRNGGTYHHVILWNGNNNEIGCYDGSFHGTGYQVPANEWFHMAVVFSNSDSTFYINGEDKGTVSAFDTSSQPLNIFGNFETGGGQSMDGNLSDVRTWNTARTQQEIQDNMNKRLNGDETGLVGYWPMNEGSGDTVYDESGNNNDGVIKGATWTTSYLFGNRTQQFDLSKVGTVGSSKISWVETLNSQNITIETRLSTDSGETWTSWAEATNGDPIPDLSEGIDVSNGLLECRQTLSTSDPDTTPELNELKIEVYA